MKILLILILCSSCLTKGYYFKEGDYSIEPYVSISEEAESPKYWKVPNLPKNYIYECDSEINECITKSDKKLLEEKIKALKHNFIVADKARRELLKLAKEKE